MDKKNDKYGETGHFRFIRSLFFGKKYDSNNNNSQERKQFKTDQQQHDNKQHNQQRQQQHDNKQQNQQRQQQSNKRREKEKLKRKLHFKLYCRCLRKSLSTKKNRDIFYYESYCFLWDWLFS